jgi:antitoxin HicB
MYTFKIHLHNESEGGYMVTVPILPSCITQGDDIDDAVKMAKDAIEWYIEELKDRGEPIPDDSNTLEYCLNLASA